jgi:hypothetical protein
MRCVAGAGLLALVGCNQIFGITPTRVYDASIDVVPDQPHVVLDWQVAQVLPSGAPDPMIRFAPLDPAPRIRITPLDVPFPADPKDDVDKPIYSAGGDGWIQIPRDYLSIPWRLEYTLADNVPHEVQWAPEDKQGHLSVPIFGRLLRDTVPNGSGYTITPPGVASYTSPRVSTTGLWTEGVVNNYSPSDGAKIDFDFFNAVSLSGAKGRPDPALGDRALLVDYITDPGSRCRIAVGSAVLGSAALEPGVHTADTPTWDARRTMVVISSIDLGDSLIRLTDALDALDSQQGYTGTLLFGVAASASMPGLTASSPGVLLPVPMMLNLLQCPYSVSMLPMTAQPTMLDSFPHFLHLQIVNTRPVLGINGLTLTSGIETVAISANNQLDVRFPVAIPTHMTLTTPAPAVVDLVGPDDHVAVGPVGGTFTLTFTQEVPKPPILDDLHVDYYDVTLHRIVGSALTTERIYTVTAPAVRIDGAVFVPGAEYVFEVRSYKGHPKAQRGDFSVVDYPYGSASVFTRTFKTS